MRAEVETRDDLVTHFELLPSRCLLRRRERQRERKRERNTKLTLTAAGVDFSAAFKE